MRVVDIAHRWEARSSGRRVRVLNDCARAYQAIRESLSDYELPPGKHIPVRIIAESLGVSVTPVRAACHRLAGEGWAIPDNKTGYFAWRPEENVIAGLYDYNRAILTAALDHADLASPGGDGEQAAIRKLREKLTRRELTNASLAACTGALFFAIVALTGNQKFMKRVRGANERLYYLRIQECRHFDDTASELVTHCDLVLAGRQDDLQQAIIAYHDRRRDLVPELYGILAAQ